MKPIIPVVRRDPFDDPAYLFELKLDGFRGLTDTIAGRMLSKNGNRLKQFETLLDALPPGFVFDGEIVVRRGRSAEVQGPAVRQAGAGLRGVGTNEIL